MAGPESRLAASGSGWWALVVARSVLTPLAAGHPELLEVALDALSVWVVPHRAVVVAEHDQELARLAIDVEPGGMELVPEVEDVEVLDEALEVDRAVPELTVRPRPSEGVFPKQRLRTSSAIGKRERAPVP